MPTQKLVDYIISLPEDTAPTLDDLILTVNAPGGSPANKKVTLANLATALSTIGGYAPLASPTFTGVVKIPDGSAAAPSLRFTTNQSGIHYDGGVRIDFAGTAVATFSDGGGMDLYYYNPLSWNNRDTALWREAAATLALRNLGIASSLRIYTSYTDGSNYERLGINTVAGTITLVAETLGSGTDNIDIAITPAGTGNICFGTYTAGAATDSTGYITIKDAGGTPRKVMIQA